MSKASFEYRYDRPTVAEIPDWYKGGVDRYLNRMGDEFGWELVSGQTLFFPDEPTSVWRWEFFFKREKQKS